METTSDIPHTPEDIKADMKQVIQGHLNRMDSLDPQELYRMFTYYCTIKAPQINTKLDIENDIDYVLLAVLLKQWVSSESGKE